MKNYLIIIVLLSFFAFVPHTMRADATDNIIIAEENITYTFIADGDKPVCVKKVSQTDYEAQRVDGTVYAVEMYDDHLTIDKASAPGVKPYYRSWEPGDLFYTGSKICLLPLSVKCGKKVRAVFESTYRQPEQFCCVYLASPHYTRQSVVSIVVPQSLADRISIEPRRLTDNMAFETATGKKGEKIYTVRTKVRPPYRNEEDAPSASVDAPQLIVRGYFDDAQALYRYFRSYLTPDENNEKLDALAADITRRCSTDIQKIDSVAAWVRDNIRYVAVEHGDYGIRPAAASDVLARRYGDCKGSAALIKALLLRAGVDARLVWIGTAGNVDTRWSDVPSLMSGNHQIAAAICGDSIIFIDGTVPKAPAGYLPYTLRGQEAMIENGDSCMLVQVPANSRTPDTDNLQGHFAVNGNDLCGSLSRSFTGSNRLAMANAYYDATDRNRPALLSRMLAYPKKNLTSENPRFSLESPSAQTCMISADKVNDIGAVRPAGDRMFIDLRPIRHLKLDVIDLKDRQHGLEAFTPVTYTACLTLDIPEGWAVESLPDNAVIDNEWFGGEIEYTTDASSIVCRASLTPRRTAAGRDDLPDRNNAVKAINRLSQTQIILKKL